MAVVHTARPRLLVDARRPLLESANEVRNVTPVATNLEFICDQDLLSLLFLSLVCWPDTIVNGSTTGRSMGMLDVSYVFSQSDFCHICLDWYLTRRNAS